MPLPTIAPGKTRIGWIGTGVMGASMAGHLMNAGFSATVVFALRFAGRLLAQTRSDAPAVLSLLLRAGRFRAISSCVRPERTL